MSLDVVVEKASMAEKIGYSWVKEHQTVLGQE
jgi:hypothetical protein